MASNVTKVFEQRIGAWLESEKKKDEIFARQVENSGKNVEGCCNYILAEVRASGQCGFDDAEIYGMARHFFDEQEVKDPGKQNVQRIVVSGHVDLTEEEKKEAMEQAKAEYRAELEKKEAEKEQKRREAQKKAAEERHRMLEEKKEKEARMQGDLFGGL